MQDPSQGLFSLCRYGNGFSDNLLSHSTHNYHYQILSHTCHPTAWLIPVVIKRLLTGIKGYEIIILTHILHYASLLSFWRSTVWFYNKSQRNNRWLIVQYWIVETKKVPSAIFHANDTVNLPVKLCLYGYKLDTDIWIITDISLTVNERKNFSLTALPFL